TGRVEPLWGWSGVDELKYSARSRKQLKSIVDMLPIRKSSKRYLAQELQYLGGKYRRYLHQDEFGPTRAQQSAAVRGFMEQLDLLSSQLRSLSDQLREELTVEFEDLNQFDATSALDQNAWLQLLQASLDLRRKLSSNSRLADFRQIEDLTVTVEYTANLLSSLDTTTQGDLFLRVPPN